MKGERKRRYLQIQAQMGQSVEDILAYKESRPYTVYFNRHGVITYFGNDENPPIQPDWLTHDFSQEQLQILRDNPVNNYIIKKHTVLKRYCIEPASRSFLSKNAPTFLEEIPEYSAHMETPDILCEVMPDRFTVSLSKDIRDELSNSDLTVKKLKFFITAKHDPHWLFDSVEIDTAKLKTHKVSVKMDLSENKKDFSVYTKRKFDTYALVVL